MSAVTLRLCGVDDEPELRRLAALDSAAPLTGTVLAVEERGELRAAIALEGRRVIADPFRLTAHLVELLQTRAAQIDRRGPRPPTRLRDRLLAASYSRTSATIAANSSAR